MEAAAISDLLLCYTPYTFQWPVTEKTSIKISHSALLHRGIFLFVRRKFQQHIWFDLQDSCDIEKNIQRNCPYHIGCFDCSHVLSAGSNLLCYLFLCETLTFAVIGYRITKVAITLRIIKLLFVAFSHVKHPSILY